MGLFDALTGRVTEIDPDEAHEDLEPILIDAESIEAAFVLYRDLMVFTNRRLVLVDKRCSGDECPVLRLGFTGATSPYFPLPKSQRHRSDEARNVVSLRSRTASAGSTRPF
jgi:hypothetical protein